jgi:hypothetical protein
MLRLLVLLLLLANGAYFAWSHDLLSSWGLGVPPQSEPQRLTQQIEPERIRVLKTDSAQMPAAQTALPVLPAATTQATTATAPTTPAATTPAIANAAAVSATSCLQAGVFTDKQSTVLRQVLAKNLAKNTWRLDATALPPRWIVYMGKYPNNSARDLKKSQLIKINVPFEVLTETALEPGLSLGSHPNQEAANQALNLLFKKGVRTARVLQEQPGQTGFQLIVPAADAATRAKLDALKIQLAGKPLQPCKS